MKFTENKAILTLLAAMALTGMFMTGCTRLTEAKKTPAETAVTTVETTQAPTESTANGVYVKLARNDVSTISLHGSSFTDRLRFQGRKGSSYRGR